MTYLNDVRNNYKGVAEEFCKYYYHNYDNTFQNLASIFLADSKFTFIGTEIIGFNNLYNHMVSLGISNINHTVLEITSQPLGQKTILISVIGTISVNKNIPQKFIDIFILQLNDSTNTYFIHNNIFLVF